jgi:hypothetical protein
MARFEYEPNFTPEILKERLDELIQIFSRKVRIYTTSCGDLTLDQLWDQYYSVGGTREHIHPKQDSEDLPKSSDENMLISEKSRSEPISLSDIHAAIGSFAGATVAKAKLAEEIGIPLDRLRPVIDELSRRGKLIDRGAFVEVIRP